MNRERLLLSLGAAALCAAVGSAAQSRPAVPATTKPIALIGGTLIDGLGGPPLRNSVVLIRGERIEKIGTIQNTDVSADYERVSTEGMSVLPGLFDPHVHLIYAGHPSLPEWFKKYATQLEQIMPVTAEQMLMAGVTTVRDLGAPLEILNVKKRIDQGAIPGPTVYAAGPFLTFGAPFGTHSLAVNGEVEARTAAKRLIAAGVNVIKFVSADRMGVDVARAIVDEAHAAGLTTTAHGRSDAEVRVAVEAGVDELQHIGTQSPEYPADIVASIRTRIAAGRRLYWSPTLGPDLNADELARDAEFLDDPRNYRGLPSLVAADIRDAVAKTTPRPPAADVATIVQRKVAQLRELGVEFVFGSDEGTLGQTTTQATWRELDVWVRHLGMDPMTAIRKATSDAAKYLRVDREVGDVSPVKYADVIAVYGNPLRHIDVLRDPAIVIKHGRRYK